MFRDVREMTNEELEKELQAINVFQHEIIKVNVNTLLTKEIDTCFLSDLNCTMTPNGELFRTDRQGFLPKMMEEMYNGRTIYKNKAIEAKKELEKETDNSKRFEIEKRIAK